MTHDLQGKGILVTRPAQMAEPFVERIRHANGRPVAFPVLEILDTANPDPLNRIIDALDEFDMAIFISPTAVNKALNLIRSRRELPGHMTIAAIGQGSRRELGHFGIRNVLAPSQRFDSEHLLAMPEMQSVSDRKIIIFRGDGGRELLGDQLTQRGAHVTYAECYRRGRPDRDAGILLRLWSRGEIQAVTITSAEGLHNLYDMVGKLGRQWLKSTPVFVSHERILDVTRELGLQHGILTPSGDEGMIAGMADWFAARHE